MWLCSQLGAREHYAIPRALFRQGSLEHLVTDAWAPPTSILRIAGKRRSGIKDRWHEELKEAPVTSFNWSLIAFEILARTRRLRDWPLIIARNHWFQDKVVSFLRSQLSTNDPQPILFSYSYSALEPFRLAKSRGWTTILGQIDPGPFEEEIVAAEVEREHSLAPGWKRAPSDYWESWREECELADRIIVNSEWSRGGLIRAGVSNEKLSVIALTYQGPEVTYQNSEIKCIRSYPTRFTPERPMRVLFLGQINLRKGLARLLEAARSVQSEPVEFLMVGPIQIRIPHELRSNPKIQWIGPVTRNKVSNHYELADIFILPTLSDGFGLTQLEALAYRLPVIASRQCGEVVTDHVDGLVLEQPTGVAIEEALRFCLNNPNRLAQLSENATVDQRFNLSFLAGQLCALVP